MCVCEREPPELGEGCASVPPPPRLALIAGEASGDLLGAGLIDALKKRFPRPEFAGVGGDGMRAAGLDASILKVEWGLDPGRTYVVVDVETTGVSPKSLVNLEEAIDLVHDIVETT